MIFFYITENIKTKYVFEYFRISYPDQNLFKNIFRPAEKNHFGHKTEKITFTKLVTFHPHITKPLTNHKIYYSRQENS